MIISMFSNLKDLHGERQLVSWPELTKLLSERQIIGEKHDAPCFSPAEWPAGDKNRRASNVERVWFGALNFDGLTKVEKDFVFKTAEGLGRIVYTTWSHGSKEGLWYFQLLVAIDRPVEWAEWGRFWTGLNAHFGEYADKRCGDMGRIYFVPSAASPEGHLFEAKSGQNLKVDDLIA